MFLSLGAIVILVGIIWVQVLANLNYRPAASEALEYQDLGHLSNHELWLRAQAVTAKIDKLNSEYRARADEILDGYNKRLERWTREKAEYEKTSAAHNAWQEMYGRSNYWRSGPFHLSLTGVNTIRTNTGTCYQRPFQSWGIIAAVVFLRHLKFSYSGICSSAAGTATAVSRTWAEAQT